jgi:hypothetical protein
VAVCSQGARVAIWKNGSHIPNFVAGVILILLMFYLSENKYVICLLEVQFLESKLLESPIASPGSGVQVRAFR